MMSRIVVLGSLNVDFVCTMPRLPSPGETVTGTGFSVFPGGKGANQAYGAARLGSSVAMIGRVGDDANGRWLTEYLAEGGVDVGAVGETGAAPTGVALIAIDETGQNHIVVVPGANGEVGPRELSRLEDLLEDGSVLLLQLEVPLPAVVEAAARSRHRGAVVILDPAPAIDIPDALLRTVDYLTPNEVELGILAGRESTGSFAREAARTAARSLCTRGASRVLVKLGASGAMLVSLTDERFWPAYRVPAVDTTAAGDAFNAAFGVALAEGQSEDRAGAFATAAAACSVQKAGAQPSMPDRADVEAMLAAGSTRG
jgi:ribokinase